MFELLSAIGGIILVDLVLSGDNALVIGAAASSLPRKQRLLAITAGGSAAIVLRIIFAIIATLLLRLPLLQAIGAVLLIFIAIKLLSERDTQESMHSQASEINTPKEIKSVSFLSAFVTILIADVTMSLDNVLAVGAIANGNITTLALGIVVSILLILVGSTLVAEVISKVPWLMDIASLVLAWTAAQMMLNDLRLGPILANYSWSSYVLSALALSTVLIADILLRRRDTRRAKEAIVKQ